MSCAFAWTAARRRTTSEGGSRGTVRLPTRDSSATSGHLGRRVLATEFWNEVRRSTQMPTLRRRHALVAKLKVTSHRMSLRITNLNTMQSFDLDLFPFPSAMVCGPSPTSRSAQIRTRKQVLNQIVRCTKQFVDVAFLIARRECNAPGRLAAPLTGACSLASGNSPSLQLVPGAATHGDPRARSPYSAS